MRFQANFLRDRNGIREFNDIANFHNKQGNYKMHHTLWAGEKWWKWVRSTKKWLARNAVWWNVHAITMTRDEIKFTHDKTEILQNYTLY